MQQGSDRDGVKDLPPLSSSSSGKVMAMASDYYACGRWSDLPKEMIVKRKRKNSRVHDEQGKVPGSDGYTILGWSTLPDELLDMISKKIDFVGFFALGGVCKNWRKFYGNHWGDFMASQAPLLILKSPYARKACSFFSISESKGYKTLLPNHWGESSTGFWKSFVGFSSGYLIRQGSLSWTKLWLINPFTRKELHIPESPCQRLPYQRNFVLNFDHAILAFVVNSEDFVVLGMNVRSSSLYIYQSRKSSWTIYSSGGYPLGVTDVVVFRRTIYAVTCWGSIGILSLNSLNLKFLEFNNVPRADFFELKLVSSNEELLVIDFRPTKHLKIYRIDLSNMEWVRLHTLGDRALFVGKFIKGYALSNPSRWGYESNCVYYIDPSYPVCNVYSMNDLSSAACHLYSMDIGPVRTVQFFGNAATSRPRQYPMAWCFSTVRDEIDYSLHD